MKDVETIIGNSFGTVTTAKCNTKFTFDKTIEYDKLPNDIKDFLSSKHHHDIEGEIFYYEKDILTLLGSIFYV